MKMYGNVINRLQENQNEIPKIEVGMGATEYLYSDRNAYEVVKVINQKDVIIRKYDHKNIGAGYGDNTWELISNPNNQEIEVVYRYGSWNIKNVITKENYEKKLAEDGYVLVSNKEYNDIMEKGKAIRYTKIKLVFGYADYYYDFEF